MTLEDRVSKRFSELDEVMNKLPSHRGEFSVYYDVEPFLQWATSVMSLIQGVFGERSPHYENVKAAYARGITGVESAVLTIKGIFRAAKSDYEGGYLFSVQTSVSGEIFGDFVGLAKTSLSEGHKDVAAVMACAALEDALKRYADLNDLDVNDKSMQEVVNAIKAKGLVKGAQKTLLDSMPKIRDYAMHAQWDKITGPDVGSVIGFVENFLLAHFS